MTASRKPKTPSMTMLVRSEAPITDIEQFCKKAGRLTVSQVVDKVAVKETLAGAGDNRSRKYVIELTFFNPEHYRAEYVIEPTEILAAFGTRFPLLHKKEIQNELKKLDRDAKTQMADLGKGKTVRNTEGESGREDEIEGDDARKGREDDEASEVGDGDTFAEKRRRQAKEQATYDEDDDGDGDGDDEKGSVEGYDDSQDQDDVAEGAGSELATQVGAVEQTFMQNLPYATNFSFSDSGCTIGLEVCTGLTLLSTLIHFWPPVWI